MMNTPHTVINNEKQLHFEVHAEGETAFLEYRFYKDQIVLMHTVVPPKLEGKGVGSALAAYAFTFAQAHHKSVKVYCTFVQGYLKRHPELNQQLDIETTD